MTLVRTHSSNGNHPRIQEESASAKYEVATTPECTYLLDAYRFAWQSGVEISLDRLHESKGDLVCEMSVRVNEPFPTLLRQGRFNLDATRTRAEWTNVLSTRANTFDWYSYIEQSCVLAVQRWRQGAPLLDLALVDDKPTEKFLLSPYIVDAAVPSGIFGDGGTGKSLLALTMALSVITGENLLGFEPAKIGPVMYLDWEWDEYEHHERLVALCKGYGLEMPGGMMWYRREVASLIDLAPSLRSLVAETGSIMVIGDSLGLARGAEPESADLTIRTLSATRSLGVPFLFTDHLNKEARGGGRAAESPFGSIYTRNLSRQLWRIESSSHPTDAQKQLGLVHCKPNLGYFSPRGLVLSTKADGAGHLLEARFDVSDVPLATLGRTNKTKAAVEVVSQNGEEGISTREIVTTLEAEGISTEDGVISTVLSRSKNKVRFQDGRWFPI